MKKREYPQITLERYVLGELSASEREKIDEAARDDSALRERLDRIRQSNEEILTRYPVDRTAREIDLRVHSKNTQEKFDGENAGRSKTPIGGVIAAVGNAISAIPAPVALTALLAVVLVPALYFYPNIGPSTERIKGLDSKLTVYRNTPEGAVALAPLDSVSAGDVLQVGYIAAGQPYGVIFSIDGRGNHTLHFPAHVDGSTELEQSGEQLLDFAYELDDAPQFEHFFLVVSQNPIQVSAVLDSVESHVSQFGTNVESGSLDLPKGCTATSIVLRK
jgi:hypothetical protein